MTGGPVFDYERSLWGLETVRPGARTIAGFRLDEALRLLPETGRVLEVGCGAGRFLRGLERARPHLQLTGVDVSRAALTHAAARSPNLDLRRVDSAQTELPAADGEFDAVLAMDVLEHLADPRRMVAEIWRVLVAGGVLHLHVPCEGDPLSLWRWLPGQAGPGALKRRLAGHVQRFRRSQVVGLLHQGGFEILRVRHSLHLIGNLADVAVFVALAWVQRRRSGTALPTTGDLLAQATERTGRRSLAARGIGLVDGALWLEARLLGRIPSWGLHITARKVAPQARADRTSGPPAPQDRAVRSAAPLGGVGNTQVASMSLSRPRSTAIAARLSGHPRVGIDRFEARSGHTRCHLPGTETKQTVLDVPIPPGIGVRFWGHG